MIEVNELQNQVKQLGQALATERQARLDREQREARNRARTVKSLIVVIAVGSAVVGVQEARAWGGCTNTLSQWGLKAFCAGDPASAAQVNSNFQTLAMDVEAKVGTIADPNVSVSGTATVTGKLNANGGLAVKGDAGASGTVSGLKGTFGSGSTGGTMLGGGNAAGNLHVDATTGATYLNYYAGKGVKFGNGASGEVGSVDASGNLSVNGQYQSSGEPLFIVCKKTTGLSTVGSTTQVFTAADCGGKLPSAKYAGALTGYSGCANGALYNLTVVNEDGTNHPGVYQYGSTFCASTGNVSAIYFKVK